MLKRRLFDFEVFYNLEGGGDGGGGTAGGAAGGGAAGGGAGGAGGAVGGGAGLAAAAAAALAGDGGGAAGGDAGAAGAAAGAGDGPKPYYPEGLADTFRGKDDKETIDKLFGDIKGRPKAPEKPEAYQLTLPKELEGRIDPKNDKVLPIYQKIAHELGLTQDQYNGTIGKLYGELMKAGLMESPVDMGAQFQELGGQGDAATRQQAGMQRVHDMAQSLNALATKKEISPEHAAALIAGVTRADQVVAMERLLALADGKALGGPRNGGQGGGAAVSRGEVEKMMMDPRYNWGTKEFDQAFKDKVDRLYEQLPAR